MHLKKLQLKRMNVFVLFFSTSYLILISKHRQLQESHSGGWQVQAQSHFMHCRETTQTKQRSNTDSEVQSDNFPQHLLLSVTWAELEQLHQRQQLIFLPATPIVHLCDIMHFMTLSDTGECELHWSTRSLFKHIYTIYISVRSVLVTEN